MICFSVPAPLGEKMKPLQQWCSGGRKIVRKPTEDILEKLQKNVPDLPKSVHVLQNQHFRLHRKEQTRDSLETADVQQ